MFLFIYLDFTRRLSRVQQRTSLVEISNKISDSSSRSFTRRRSFNNRSVVCVKRHSDRSAKRWRLFKDCKSRIRMEYNTQKKIYGDLREGMIGAADFKPKFALIITWRNMTMVNRRPEMLLVVRNGYRFLFHLIIHWI